MEKSVHSPEYALLRAELRRAREAGGLSQRQLAERLEVPHSWVAKVETGERRIDLVEFCWFVAACGEDSLAAIGRLVPRMHLGRAARRAKGGRSK